MITQLVKAKDVPGAKDVGRGMVEIERNGLIHTVDANKIFNQCFECETAITNEELSFSQRVYGKPICRNCQEAF